MTNTKIIKESEYIKIDFTTYKRQIITDSERYTTEDEKRMPLYITHRVDVGWGYIDEQGKVWKVVWLSKEDEQCKDCEVEAKKNCEECDIKTEEQIKLEKEEEAEREKFLDKLDLLCDDFGFDWSYDKEELGEKYDTIYFKTNY